MGLYVHTNSLKNKAMKNKIMAENFSESKNLTLQIWYTSDPYTYFEAKIRIIFIDAYHHHGRKHVLLIFHCY